MVRTDVTDRQIPQAVVTSHGRAGCGRARHHFRVALTAESPRLARRRDLAPVLGIAAGVLALHLVLSGRYGFHHDELYLMAAGRHPALGYVDQPPLTALIARGLAALAGEHLWPLRVLAGAGHAALVVVVAVVAAGLGGGRRAVVLAALATAVMPVFVEAGSRWGPLSLALVWWAMAVLGAVMVLDGGDPRWWLAVGVMLGLGLETTRVGGLLATGLVAGLAVVRDARRHVRGGWFWAGMATAAVVWLPNLVWQTQHGWPLADDGPSGAWAGGDGAAGFLVRQLVMAGPAGLVLSAAGLVWAWRHPPWRALVVAAAVIGGGLALVGTAAAELAPVYVVALPAGAVAAEAWAASDMHRWRQAVVAVVASGVVLLPAMAPAASVRTYRDLYHEDIHAALGEEIGWPDTAGLIARVYEILAPEEREDARVVTARAGEAGAIDLYGPSRGMPRGTALSADAGASAWWPDGEPAGTVIFVGYSRQDLASYCDVMGPIAIVGNSANLLNEGFGTPISMCRTMRVTPAELREALRRGG
jgi:Dolichyl-phosphate-mannose-protein mannosyltransferase